MLKNKKRGVMKRIVCAAALLLTTLPVLAAADLTGKWAGSFKSVVNDEKREDEVLYLDLKQTGSELTGRVGPSVELNWPMSKGKVEGTKVTFEVQMSPAGQPGPLMVFALQLVDDHLKGSAKAEFQGTKMTAMIDAQRVRLNLRPESR